MLVVSVMLLFHNGENKRATCIPVRTSEYEHCWHEQHSHAIARVLGVRNHAQVLAQINISREVKGVLPKKLHRPLHSHALQEVPFGSVAWLLQIPVLQEPPENERRSDEENGGNCENYCAWRTVDVGLGYRSGYANKPEAECRSEYRRAFSSDRNVLFESEPWKLGLKQGRVLVRFHAMSLYGHSPYVNIVD